jgi:GT2 family glycosyltransferase
MSSRLSVVIVNFNAGSHLASCLSSVREHAGETDIIVIDNASTDGSEMAAQEARFAARLIRNPSNVGFAAAANRGINHSESRFVLLLNPDCLLLPGAVDVLVRELEEHPDCAAVGPRVFDEDGSVQGSARGDPSLMTGLFGRTSLLTRLFPRSSAARRNVRSLDAALAGKESAPVDWISGACLLLRASAVKAIGGFDERYFLYWEDADLCRRLRKAGFSVRYMPAAEVIHVGGRSSRTVKAFSIKAFHKSAFVYYATHVARTPASCALAWLILEARCRWKLLTSLKGARR